MNEDKFTGKADVYAKYRPSYPDALLDFLYAERGFSDAASIADIGAGTGIWSKKLAERGSDVVCVEPNADMLAQARQALAGLPCRFVQAPAEHTTLGGASVDFITVAQAFHWFDPALFRAECQRILRPQGKVVLIWNQRGESPARQDIKAINQRYCPNFKGFSGSILKSETLYADFFADGLYEKHTFPNDGQHDEDGFIGGCLSSSYAPNPGQESYAPYVEALRAVFRKYAPDGKLLLPYSTACYIGRV